MKLKLKDPWSAITHGIAVLLAAAGAAPLLVKAARNSDTLHIVALAVFILTMILLYTASTVYHFCGFYRKGKPPAAQSGSHDDLYYDRRKLYACMSDRAS